MKNKEIHLQLTKNLLDALKCKSLDIKIFENFSSVQFNLDEYFDHYNPEETPKGNCNLIFKVKADGIIAAAFNLKDMPGCSGMMIANDLFVSPDFRNLKVGSLLTRFMSDFARYYGYGLIQGNDKDNNIYQRRIFEKQGWNKASTFTNPKTGNVLNVWFLNLN